LRIDQIEGIAVADDGRDEIGARVFLLNALVRRVKRWLSNGVASKLETDRAAGALANAAAMPQRQA
jgi:hypothetical protein